MMSVSQDDLAEKLYERWRTLAALGPLSPWAGSSAVLRETWEEVAKLARAECVRLAAANFQALLNMTADDPEAAPYRAGIELVIDSMRKAAAETADTVPS